jgi:hypothetical protein
LGGFDEYSKLLNELIQKEGKDGSNYNFLRKLEAGFQTTDCAKEVISAAVPLEEGLSVSQPTKAIRPCSVCSILSFVCKS